MHIDRHIAISAGWIAGPAFGVAMMVAPDYLYPSPIVAGCLFWGGLGEFAVTILIVFVLSIREAGTRQVGALTVIVLGLITTGGGIAWYFWPSKPTEEQNAEEMAMAVAQLAQLGWTVTPDDSQIQFSIRDKPLPPMDKSAELLKNIHRSFVLSIAGVTNINGLHYVGPIQNCHEVQIMASDITDISELHDFVSLKKLIISQVPMNQSGSVTGVLNISPLSPLIYLESLSLNNTTVRDIAPIEKF